MAHNSKKSAELPIPRAQKQGQMYISNCRSALTALVIVHHTAISYGGDGVTPYQSSLHPSASSMALVGFNHVNQTFFVGTFLFLAGNFSQRTLQRKSRRVFAEDRLYRLALPAVAYTLLAPPICTAILTASRGQRLRLGVTTEHLMSLRGVRGPAWFMAVLLVFDLALASSQSFRQVPKKREPYQRNMSSSERTRTRTLYCGLAGLTTAEFLLRMVCPIGQMFRPLSLNVGYLPQYLASYLLSANVEAIERCFPSRLAAEGLLFTSVQCTAVLAHSRVSDPLASILLRGGLNPLAACYALWTGTTGYLLGSGSLAAFSAWANVPIPKINALAYPAFLVHMPTSVALGALIDGW